MPYIHSVTQTFTSVRSASHVVGNSVKTLREFQPKKLRYSQPRFSRKLEIATKYGKQEVPDLRSGGIAPNLTPVYCTSGLFLAWSPTKMWSPRLKNMEFIYINGE